MSKREDLENKTEKNVVSECSAVDQAKSDTHEAPAESSAGPVLCSDGLLSDDLLTDGLLSNDSLSDGLLIDANYEIVKKIGTGGMGDVYLGKDLLLGRSVAIKVMHNSLSSDHVIRFQREAQILGRLNHPHIAPIYQLGVSEQGKPYIVMEYVDGTALTQIIADQAPLNPYWILNVLIQLVDALKAAHSAGISHRDLKPENILVTTDSNGHDSIKVIDFGIAKDISAGQDLTKSGEMLGTPLYMSPEQCKGSTVDYRTDIYSAGCIIFEMLTGKRPFHGASVLETVTMHATMRQPALPKHLKAFDYVLSKMLAKNPDDRYQSIEQAQLDFTAAVLQFGQFKYSPFMFTALTRQRQLPENAPKPMYVLFSLIAAGMVLAACANAVPFPGRTMVLVLAFVCLLLALIRFGTIIHQPLKAMQENEKLLAKGPVKKSSVFRSEAPEDHR